MPDQLVTFRDHFLSVFQSAVDDIIRKAPGTDTTPGARAGTDNAFVKAAAKISDLKDKGLAIPELAPPGFAQDRWNCARLGLELMEAQARGDSATAEKIRNQVEFSTCDPKWADTLVNYVAYFGPDGHRAEIPYIRPSAAIPGIIAVAPNSRIALVGDWGTGTPTAVTVLEQIKLQQPNIFIHLGDIYYSGTPEECEVHFLQILDRALDRANSKIPVFNLAGNHDMYDGGVGYYGLLPQLNAAPFQQKASFLCLRATDDSWQILGMDTGLHDYNPLSVDDAVTFLDPAEEKWHLARIQEFPGRTILLSHHQLFSAFSRIGSKASDGSVNPCNPQLLASFKKFNAGRKIAAWFWGHEHNLCIYQKFAELDYGRCIGHGGIPVRVGGPSDPYGVLAGVRNPPALVAGTKLADDGTMYAHGFAMLTPSGASFKVDYYQDQGKAIVYSETI
jgi:3',5'-cyclic AMP phosphodiesterase CpdA